jgi:integrase
MMRKVVLYRLVTDENGKSHYVRVKGRKNSEGRLGSYYLRYRENGKRKWESVGDDLALAEQEQKARQASLNSPTPLTIISEQKTLRKEVQRFLANKSESWRYILAVFGDFYGWDKDPANFQREDFKAYAAHLANLRPAYKDCLAARTQRNYLDHLTTFLRNTGRVVTVARNEQDATIKKATALIANTLVLTQADFPKVNKKIKDYYPATVVQAMFAACQNFREFLMLSLFYYTGCRENEIAHLHWTDVRWEAKELFVREKRRLNWTTKTYEDRGVEIPDQLLEVLKEGCEKRTHKLILPNRDGNPDGHLLKKVQQIAKRAGITCGECRDCMERKGRNCQNFGLHKFRYTYGRVLDEGKTPIEDIRVALGHKDITTTIGYLGGGDKKQRRANIERSFPKTA